MNEHVLEPPSPVIEAMPLSRRRRTSTALAMTALLGAGVLGFPGLGRPSAAAIRHDPVREKTPEDEERLAAARLRRERRAAKRNNLKL